MTEILFWRWDGRLQLSHKNGTHNSPVIRGFCLLLIASSLYVTAVFMQFFTSFVLSLLWYYLNSPMSHFSALLCTLMKQWARREGIGIQTVNRRGLSLITRLKFHICVLRTRILQAKEGESRHHKPLGKSGPELGKSSSDFVTYLQL